TISPDGKYCSYVINGSQDYTIIQTTKGEWKYKLAGNCTGFFSGDNQYYIYQANDSLCYLSLKEKTTRVMPGIVTYKLPLNNSCGEWVAIELKDKNLLLSNLITGEERRFYNVSKYSFMGGWFSCQLNNAANELIVVQLSTAKVRKYGHVSAHSFDNSWRVMVLQTEHVGIKELQWVNLRSGKITTVWKVNAGNSSSINGYSVDQSAKQLAFIVQSISQGKINKLIWYYKEGMAKAVPKVLRDTPSTKEELEVTDATFSNNGRYIIVSMQETVTDLHTPNKDAVQVDVWNYKDTFLMSAQVAATAPGLTTWLAAKAYRFSMLAEKGETLTYLSGAYEELFETNGEYAVLQRQVMTDRFWEDYWVKPKYHIVSLKNGKRIFLKEGILPSQFSPDKTWLLCYDSKIGQYLKYDVSTGKYSDLSSGAGVFFGEEDEFNGTGRQRESPRGFIGWIKESNYFLVYDHYDIWQLDGIGKKPAKNLTCGRRNKVRFEITESDLDRKVFYNPLAQLVLTAVNMENKDNGFYALTLGGHGGIKKLYMGPYVLYLGGLKYGQNFWGRYSAGRIPLKARDADIWLLIRQSATEAPNYFIARGLKDLKALTTLQPYEKYNWLRAELINFNQQDTSHCKGILYKPENFDSTKKYPVIIHYYDQFSLCLNQYPLADYTASGYINIPWFVSRGYLVFLPDIYFNKNSFGAAALNAVEGGATWLSQQSYVDSTKMGIAGHSMGGGHTNYILTHSNRFAAVFEGAGVSNWVSSAFQIDRGEAMSRLMGYRNMFKGGYPWVNSENCMDNPILHVDKVSSPLLIFHCKADAAVPFEQAVELFISMRRMGKKAWLLQYDQGYHSTQNLRDSRDLTIRVTQFFDHYLKGALAPLWMTTGIRAQLKGIATGYEFDESGTKP
ncbi:MAG: S9 family peptidase, partial [Flavisolibacter sp.]|nr:S9 family peptidase [Flavisolibacter sp.]